MKTYRVSGFDIWEYDELTSTNTEAMRLIMELGDRSVILTFRQTQGRGQLGNAWESEAGSNLSLSIVLKPCFLEASRQFAISMIIALGCRDFISGYTSGCEIKWPNDIYVGEKKIGGILIEHGVAGSCISYSVCGVGLNINQEKFYSDAPNPVSLYQLSGEKYELESVLANLLVCIGKRYALLEDYEALEKEYLSVLYRREGVHCWKDENATFKASVIGVDEYGRLILEDEFGGVREYGFKEVVFC